MLFENYPFFFGGPGSDIANYFGLLLTIVGFAITIVSVRNSKQASIDAKNEVINVRKDISKIDAVNDLSTAISLIEEIRTLQREAKWFLLPDRYSSLKKLLISIKNSYPELTDQQKSTIQGTLQHVSDIDKRIEMAVKKKTEPENIPRFNSLLSKQKDDIYEMLVELRNNIGVRK